MKTHLHGTPSYMFPKWTPLTPGILAQVSKPNNCHNSLFTLPPKPPLWNTRKTKIFVRGCVDMIEEDSLTQWASRCCKTFSIVVRLWTYWSKYWMKWVQPTKGSIIFYIMPNPLVLIVHVTLLHWSVNINIFLYTGTSGAYTAGQPRRSCLKPSQYNALQRSHSVHSYSYSSLQCVHHHLGMDQCCDSSFYSNPQLNASHAAVCGKAKEFPVYYSKSRTNIPNCTRHNSISGYIGYKSPLHPDDYSLVPPDLCKLAPSATKRVGWKEVLHEGSESTMMPSLGSTDTSTSSTTSTITLGPKHPSSCSRQNSIKSNNAVKIGNVDKIHTIDDQ